MISKTIHHVPNGRGWRLALRRVRAPKLVPGRRPVVIVPGYGMNSFIFGFHPRGASLEEYLAEKGLDVWAVDLRAQGESIRDGGSMRFDMVDLALTDLRLAIDHVAARAEGGTSRVDVLGASLGATLMYMLAARGPSVHLGSLVAIGGPLRWIDVHPVIRWLARSPEVIGMVPFPETRRLAQRALPLILRFPKVLEIYVHTDIVDTRQMSTMLRTVETPSRHVNRQIAHWILDRDLKVDGINVTEALGRVVLPLLCVVANADGIVPPSTALSGYHAIGSVYKDVLEVGDDRMPFAHADLFVSNDAHELVFEPIALWLERMANVTLE
ncbi:MAG: alpha/beta fold hydrolase [Deltaproteobacteria bacterium]|nr:alpha/beta fold hydrolase [Deltaproteobacteria bacterium]